ncbi:Cell division protein FtsP [Trichinella pseudospiralis]|uniref:Uncharacterized protein n=1 Tax=Trichinella pseudospiralis TaxID=6337 RepID=A0A0V1FRA2_TRIPS|nr:hypothetical protein T4D_3831 [Trichinella pseudospiralis]
MVCWPRRTDGNDQRRCDSGDLFCSNGADLSICHASHSRCRSTNDHGLQAIFQTERRSAVRICAVNAWKCKRNPTNDDWLAPYHNSAPFIAAFEPLLSQPVEHHCYNSGPVFVEGQSVARDLFPNCATRSYTQTGAYKAPLA